MMTEMEFFRVFELRPVVHEEHPTLRCWKRDSGLYGEISQRNCSVFEVRESSGDLIDERTTFNQALKLLIAHITEVLKK
jgi:hypothetical protein